MPFVENCFKYGTSNVLQNPWIKLSIKLKGTTLVMKQVISSKEAMQGKSKFFRIHRSFIVSLDKIRSFSNEMITVGNKELPIGKLYRHGFLEVQGS